MQFLTQIYSSLQEMAVLYGLRWDFAEKLIENTRVMRATEITLICPQCGRSFRTSASRKKFCGAECARAYENEHKRRTVRVRSAILSKQTGAKALKGKEFLSISEAARLLGVCRPTIYKYMKSGSLTPVRKSEGVVRISREQLLRSELKVERLPSLDVSDYITKDEVLKKYDISETWFHRRIKMQGVKSIRVGAKSYYPAAELERVFQKKTEYSEVKEWYTSEELSRIEGLSRKYICELAHKLAIPVKRAGAVCYISKEGWDNRRLAPAVIEKEYITADQAKERYHIGGKRFYDTINANAVTKVSRNRCVCFRINELDRLFKNREPQIPDEIRRNYIRSADALSFYHVGQKRFSAETQAAGVEKIRTEGGFVWYRKEQLDRLFKKLI